MKERAEPRTDFRPRARKLSGKGQGSHAGRAGDSAAVAGRSAARIASRWRGGWSARTIRSTARVTVNRFWERLLRHRHREDERGFRPTRRSAVASRTAGLARLRIHATDVAAAVNRTPPQAWDVKHMLKLIVMSATYRQSAAADAGASGKGSLQPAAGARAAVSHGRRDDPRPGAGGERPAESGDRRAERLSGAGAQPVEGNRLPASGDRHGRMADQRRAGALPPRRSTPSGVASAPIRPSRRSTPRAATFASRGVRAPTRRCRRWPP